jgi:hypothetical protein
MTEERYDLKNTKKWMISEIKHCRTCEELDELILSCSEECEDWEVEE